MKPYRGQPARFLREASRTAVLLFLLAGAGTACERHTVAHVQRPLPLDGWEQCDTIRFPVDSIPEAGNYRLRIDLRTTNDYSYQSIYLEIRQAWDAPRMSRCDTVRCQLATAGGDVTGAGISLFQYAFPFAVQRLEQGQHGELVVRHIMRRDLLRGLASIGLKIEKQNETYIKGNEFQPLP